MPFDTRDKHPIDHVDSSPSECVIDVGIVISVAVVLTLGLTDKLKEQSAVAPISFGILCALFRTYLAIRSSMKGIGLFNSELYVFDRLRCKSEHEAANGSTPATQPLILDNSSIKIDVEPNNLELEEIDFSDDESDNSLTIS